MIVKATYSWGKMIKATRPAIAQMLNDTLDVIDKDIRMGIDQRKNIDNSPTKPLKANTIKAKKRKGSARPDLPRVDTGTMSGVLGSGGPYVKQRATASQMKAILNAPSTKAPYGIYQDNTRPWWGIAKRTMPTVDKVLKNAGVKIVRSIHNG